MAAKKTSKKKKASRKKAALFSPADILLILFVVAAFSFRFFSCEDDRGEKLRPLLNGDWATAHPAYTGASLSISPTKITFFTVENTVVQNTITEFKYRNEPQGDFFRIYYRNDTGEFYALSLYLYKMKGEDVIRMKYQKQIPWRRAPSDSGT
jgi:hypothetical protein